jgi:hypothetical protein
MLRVKVFTKEFTNNNRRTDGINLIGRNLNPQPRPDNAGLNLIGTRNPAN